MPINPVLFAHGVCDEFLRSLFSAFPLSASELSGQARTFLEQPSSLDIPLVNGPFVSLSVETLADGRLPHLRADIESKRNGGKESLGNLIPVKPKPRRKI